MGNSPAKEAEKEQKYASEPEKIVQRGEMGEVVPEASIQNQES